jgi:hypothetical protein
MLAKPTSLVRKVRKSLAKHRIFLRRILNTFNILNEYDPLNLVRRNMKKKY